MFTSLMVSVILIAMVTMLITRPGVSDVITQILGYGAGAIKGMLGTSV